MISKSTRAIGAFVLAAATAGAMGCNKSPENKPATGTALSGQSVTTTSADVATIGKPAPDFELADLDGKKVSLSNFKGKIVVLEWFNPGCPFVKNSHTKGSLIDTGKKWSDKGIVWLAVNSSASGKQGFGVEANRAGVKEFNLTYPVLLDESGDVGHKYGATNTPNMFVIDANGVLAYRGAIDNSPDAARQSAPDGKVVNYVDDAVTALLAHQPIAVAETKAYGCDVKYAH